MAYVAKSAEQLREEGGSLLKKIASELDLIDTAIDALGAGTGALTSAHIFVGNGSAVATDVAMSGDITIDNAGATTIGAGKVTNAMHAANTEDGTVVKNCAESDVIGGIPLVFMIPVSAGANGNVDVVSTHKVRILDAYVILRGTGVASAVFTVTTATPNSITSGMSASGADTVLSRTTLIDDAYYTIAAGGTIRVTGSGGATMPAALVVVTAVRVA